VVTVRELAEEYAVAEQDEACSAVHRPFEISIDVISDSPDATSDTAYHCCEVGRGAGCVGSAPYWPSSPTSGTARRSYRVSRSWPPATLSPLTRSGESGHAGSPRHSSPHNLGCDIKKNAYLEPLVNVAHDDFSKSSQASKCTA